MRIAILVFALALAVRGEDTSTRIRTLSDQLQIEYDLAHYEKALTIAEELYRLKPTAGVLFNVAQCHRKLGQFKEAAALYRSYLSRADPASPEAVKAQELLTQVEALIKQQEATAKAQPHSLSPLPAEALKPTPPPPAQAPPPPPSHKTFYVLAGVSAAALAAGVVFGLGSKNASNELTSQKHGQAEAESLANDVEKKALVADGFFILAGAFGLGAVIAW